MTNPDSGPLHAYLIQRQESPTVTNPNNPDSPFILAEHIRRQNSDATRINNLEHAAWNLADSLAPDGSYATPSTPSALRELLRVLNQGTHQ